MARVEAAWPAVPTGDALFGASGVAPIAQDRLLRMLLELVQSFDVGLEWFLTAARATLLQQAAQADAADTDEQSLTFYCALARQCFINEYVFAYPPNEADEVRRLQERLSAALASGAPVPPLWVAALAAYVPLHTLPFADALLGRDWPDAVRAVLLQQVSEPADEARHRAAMPRLTRIEDASSQAVRAQYEVNPYPRWTKMAQIHKPKTVDHYLRERFPLAPFRPLGKPKLDYLIAGCGSGQHVASVATWFSDAQFTAIDLSLTSLGYAKRMTANMGLTDIAFGQADILELASLGRTFDVIDSSGVLHHFSDGYAGWRVLLSILRPGGIMRVALYSTIARRHIEAGRQYIAAKGYTGSAADIRQCRQDIMAMAEDEPIRSVMTIHRFLQHERLAATSCSTWRSIPRRSRSWPILRRERSGIPRLRDRSGHDAALRGTVPRRSGPDQSRSLARVRAGQPGYLHSPCTNSGCRSRARCRAETQNPNRRDVAQRDEGGDARNRVGFGEQRRMALVRHVQHVDIEPARPHRIDGRGRKNVRIGAAHHHQRHARERIECAP